MFWPPGSISIILTAMNLQTVLLKFVGEFSFFLIYPNHKSVQEIAFIVFDIYFLFIGLL